MCRFVNTDNGILFGNICWILWKTRNERIFSNSRVPASGVAAQCHHWSTAVSEALSRTGSLPCASSSRFVANVAWDPGPAGWVTLNTDGSFDRGRRRASAGGLLRDSEGKCLFAFTMNLGTCSITRAEMRGAIEGLKRTWEAGFKKVVLQMDLRAAISLLSSADSTDHQHGIETMEFQELRRRE
ncbi:Putative ribonuclease H protein At1g65750 [Linum perenne]